MDHHGIWRDTGDQHFDEGLAEALKSTFSGKSIVDFGCGWQKKYARYLEADGYDGNPNTLDGSVLDISQPFDLGKKYEVVLCLEVIEHIPQEFESTVLQNICNHSSGFVVISWARPGQGGRHHVNCRPQSYVCEQMERHGFVLLATITDGLRKESRLSWFKKNLLTFFRNDLIP